MNNMDKEANQFAMELLMPRDWLLADVEKMRGIDIEGDDKKVMQLAKRYKVSVQAMTIRLGQLLLSSDTRGKATSTPSPQEKG